MTTNQIPAPSYVEHVVTSCPIHGDKVCGDAASMARYVSLALECQSEAMFATHAAWHESEGHDCWTCCDQCVVDPYGWLAHVDMRTV